MINRLALMCFLNGSTLTDRPPHAALVFCISSPSEAQPRTLARGQQKNLRSSPYLSSPVHNGSAQLSYFIYSCTASNPTPSPHNSLPPSCARELASKRALHPIHNVKQPKNKRRRTPPNPFSILSISIAGRRWWAREDLNFRPHAYQARALTN